MRNTRHMTYNTQHVQLNSHEQQDRRPDSRRDKRRQKHYTCNMQPTSQTIRDVGGSFHRGLPLTCGANPFRPVQDGALRPATPRDAKRRHETSRDAMRRHETPRDASRRLRDVIFKLISSIFSNCRHILGSPGPDFSMCFLNTSFAMFL